MEAFLMENLLQIISKVLEIVNFLTGQNTKGNGETIKCGVKENLNGLMVELIKVCLQTI